MRKYLKGLFVGLLQLIIVQVSIGQEKLEEINPNPEHPQALFVTLNLLDRYHYRKIELDDSLSSVIFDNYISSLDPSKSYFLEKDIKYFERYRTELDDQLQQNDLSFGFDIFKVYRSRALARYDKVSQILENEFDFEKEEYLETDYDKAEWVSDPGDLDAKWRLFLKNQAIPYKINNKEWPDIKEALEKRYKQSEKSIYQYKSEDVFQAYLNALTSAYDPHTDYFSPITSENFQINMSLSLEGIGARLSKNLDYVVVAEIVPGGPAYKSKALQKDDKIIGVGQGDEGEFEDVIGWRLDDVVQLIRGPKGSVVNLIILKNNAEVGSVPDTLRLVREKIKLEEQAAKAEMIPVKINNETYNLGVITVPSFYINFDERNSGVEDYKSTTRDVKNLIDDLNEQGMDGLMIDLRFNGGGSLQEAIDLTGLFIPSGPVVQVRNTDQSIDPLFDDDENQLFYDGPLAVLTNRFSASASEIFSGAIQDYNRGIIIGENTFGKGTVQNLIDLDRPVVNYLNNLVSFKKSANQEFKSLQVMRDAIVKGDLRLGQLKMTLAKFYRATGSSTQNLGVKPDISFPTIYKAEDYGESASENALPWDEIQAQAFQPTNNISEELRDKLYKIYLEDLNNDPVLQKLVKDIQESESRSEDSRLSLNLQERKSNNSELDDEDLVSQINAGEIQYTMDEEGLKKLSEDPYLKEGLKLLAEMSKLSIKSN